MRFKTTIQRELDRFYASVEDEDFNIRKVTKGAFSRARMKLNPEAFKHLSRTGLKVFYEKAPVLKWNGYRLLAVDGSKLLLPRHKTIIEEFGSKGVGPKADVEQSTAICSILYDTLNLVPIDGQIAPESEGERDLFLKHLNDVQKGDLILFDRGYPAIWLFFLLYAKGVDFCMRMSDFWWVKVDEFNKSDLTETTVSFELPSKDREKLTYFPEMIGQTITVRLVKVELITGETEILCTSLLDPQKFPIEIFKELYHKRWTAEEALKMLKTRAEVENFSGKTAIAVKQDFHAKIFAMALCSMFAHPIEQKVKQEFATNESRKLSQQINHTSALAELYDILIPSFVKNRFSRALRAFDDLVYKTREVVRPNRSNLRKHKPSRKYYMTYKRL